MISSLKKKPTKRLIFVRQPCQGSILYLEEQVGADAVVLITRRLAVQRLLPGSSGVTISHASCSVDYVVVVDAGESN